MTRPSPRQVYDDPNGAWTYLIQSSDDDFEGQHFDRKEAGRPLGNSTTIAKNALDGIKDHVIKTVSAFANSNFEGGLLVLGISSGGEVLGIDHLGEDQRNSLTNLNTLLRTHAAEVKYHACADASGVEKTLCFIYSAYVPSAICETPDANPKAWVRNGQQSLMMSQEVRDQIRLRKGLLDSDSLPWSPFSVDDVDAEVVKEFRRVFHPEITAEFSDERLLREAGAIVKQNGELAFTLPGLLFFAANPQRVLPHAYLRLLKFVVPSSEFQRRGTPSFDKDFRGPVTKQIRAARTFLRETSFFERLQHRKPDGGFAEQQELPPIAVDEAIVNAITHRDYHTKNPVSCEHYTDSFVVKNPGRIRQPNVDLPDRFDLSTTTLDSMPNNRKLLEWLRLMKDSEGQSFVQALSEGTKRMTKEMLALGLRPPSVLLRENETVVILLSKAEERKAAFLASIKVPQTAFINLFPLIVSSGTGHATSDEVHLRLGEFTKALGDSLLGNGWYIDRSSFSRIVTHRTGADLAIPENVRKIIRFYPAYCIQIHELFGRAYISVDYTCQVLSVVRANELGDHLPIEHTVGRICVAQSDSWRTGRIVTVDAEWITVHFFDSEDDQRVPASRVIPHLSLAQIEAVLRSRGIRFDLYGTIKKYSLASEQAAARKRAEKIQSTMKILVNEIFPVRFGEFEGRMLDKAVTLSEVDNRSDSTFHIERLSEPAVEFRNHQQMADVRDGITKYGSYDSDPHPIELVPVCLTANRRDMESLIERLKTGKYKFRGAERTFAARFSYSAVVTAETAEDVDREVARLLSEHPEWTGNEHLNRLFLVQTPEMGYSSDDESSPYFIVKRRLLEAGVPCQMVDTGTLRNPDWKDLNLALNIIAKCGITPWVLPENIPEADFFVGLSYTQSRDGQKILGFANVFSSYGKWEFYAGNTTAFDVRNRSEHLASLARKALERLKRDHALPSGPNLVFHHSVRLSKEDYAAIISGVRSVSPDASVLFVWVNAHNNFRMFDSRSETDGSVQRGSFVPISRRKVLLSTTGYNTYRKMLGTPRPLELSGDQYRPGVAMPVGCDARTLALQVLNLTKLNWASTDAFTAEPITIKYAGDIAYLTAAFLRQREPFQLHPVLERTPWFV
jgi:predicted HTH transcriptional regulator